MENEQGVKLVARGRKAVEKARGRENKREQTKLALEFAVLFFGIMVLLQLPVAFLYDAGLIQSILYWSSAMLSISFPVSVFVYLLAVKKLDAHKAIAELGLTRNRLSARILAMGLLLFAIIFLMEAAITLVEQITGIRISTHVSLLLQGAPLWFYVFAVFVAPLNEEIMFRGFFVPRLGIVLSALLFAIPHLTYASTYEIEAIAAFVFGLLAGYVFKKTRSLYATIIAHALVNAIAVVGFLV
ncbi:MAG: CPBP family intramembrane glutamic endopeptidase [Candidatus Micrarchaeia archaeon]